MKAITLLQPQKIVFGTGCIETFTEDYKKMGLQRLMVLTAPPILPFIEEPLANLRTLSFLPQLEMRPSSNAPNPVESREPPPTSSFPGFSEPP